MQEKVGRGLLLVWLRLEERWKTSSSSSSAASPRRIMSSGVWVPSVGLLGWISRAWIPTCCGICSRVVATSLGLLPGFQRLGGWEFMGACEERESDHLRVRSSNRRGRRKENRECMSGNRTWCCYWIRHQVLRLKYNRKV